MKIYYDQADVSEKLMYIRKEISYEDFGALLEYTIKNQIQIMHTIDKSCVSKNARTYQIVNQISKEIPLMPIVNFPETSKINDKCTAAY